MGDGETVPRRGLCHSLGDYARTCSFHRQNLLDSGVLGANLVKNVVLCPVFSALIAGLNSKLENQ